MKIPGTHKHASIASIPHSKEFKEGHTRIFDAAKAAANCPSCQAMKGIRGELYKCSLPKYHKGDHKWVKA